MKILVDQNISFRLLPMIKAEFPEAYHVRDLDLMDCDDAAIFHFARMEGFDAILTLDSDFHNIQLTQGAPPKIIWLRVGNCSTASLAKILRSNSVNIQEFAADDTFDCLEIFF